MACAVINIDHRDAAPTAEILTCSNGQRFIVLRAGGSLSIYLAGFDAESQACARAIAAVLTKAADDMGTFAPAAPDPTVDALTQLEALGAGDEL